MNTALSESRCKETERMNKMQAVIFDMDGVIFDSENLVVKCWKVVAEKYGIEDVEAACKDCLGVNSIESKERFLKKYGEEFPYDEYKSEMSALYHQTAAAGGLDLKPGVVELLTFLKEHKYGLAVASSTRRAVVESQLKNAKVLDFFDEIICGDMVKKSKPDPEIYLAAAEKMKVNPKECYAIEDSYNGIRSAYSAGMEAIMVPDLLLPTDETREKCCVICDSLLEVIEFIKTTDAIR